VNNTIKILLGFDFGTKRIGVAIGQTITQTARPLETLAAKNGVPEWSVVSALVHQWQPDALVVGVPLNMDGTDQPISHAAREFAKLLGEKSQLPVYTADERLTTKAAREHLFAHGGYQALQDGQVDSVAAQLILQHWFAENIK
jgi:putative holliday junction resolvase